MRRLRKSGAANLPSKRADNARGREDGPAGRLGVDARIIRPRRGFKGAGAAGTGALYPLLNYRWLRDSKEKSLWQNWMISSR